MELTTSVTCGGVRLALSWRADIAVLQRQLEGGDIAASETLFVATAPKMAQEMTLLLAQAHRKLDQLILVQSCLISRAEAESIMEVMNGNAAKT